MVQNLLEKIKLLSRDNNDEEIYRLINEQLSSESNDIHLWLSLSIVAFTPPYCDHEISITCLEKALYIEKNNAIALLILAYVYEHALGGISDELLDKIGCLHTNSSELDSMLKYVASWSYAKNKKNDLQVQEKLLKESIHLCSHYVWNYIHLARLYFKQGRNDEAQELVKKAINNVRKVYSDDTDYDPTDVNEFLNERIKGIYLTDVNFKFIKEMINDSE